MSTMNIAIIGGVVLLLLALVAMRRRRDVDDDLGLDMDEPMPLAAAAGQTAATTELAPAALGDWPAPLAWPPAVEEPAVDEAPTSEDAVAPEPDAEPEPEPEPEVELEFPAGLEAEPEAEVGFDVQAEAEQDDAPDTVAAEPASAYAGWGDDELITEPGWPMPGDLDMAWEPAAEEPAAPAWEAPEVVPVEPVAADLAWMSHEPAAEEELPQWTPPAEVAAEASDWTAGAEDVAAPWADAPADGSPAAEIPVWQPEDDAGATGELPEIAIAAPGGDEPSGATLAELGPGFAPVSDDAFAGLDIGELSFGDAPEPDLVFAAPGADVEIAATVAPEPVVAPPAPADDAVRTGRFALGGFALQPGQQAYGGVSFRAELPEAPGAWAVAPAEHAAPGTVVLALEGVINCGPDGLEVVTDPGFAPTTEGFTVRVAAAAPGPFAASGTFTVR